MEEIEQRRLDRHIRCILEKRQCLAVASGAVARSFVSASEQSDYSSSSLLAHPSGGSHAAGLCESFNLGVYETGCMSYMQASATLCLCVSRHAIMAPLVWFARFVSFLISFLV